MHNYNYFHYMYMPIVLEQQIQLKRQKWGMSHQRRKISVMIIANKNEFSISENKVCFNKVK